MRQFPAFFNLTGQRVVVVGSGDEAVRKVRLLVTAGAVPVILVRSTVILKRLTDTERRRVIVQPVWRLDEATGVRLSLTLLATQPIIRSERIRSLVAGIEAMSVEETYYWYAKCVGPNAAAARKAIRILLADDETGAQQ